MLYTFSFMYFIFLLLFFLEGSPATKEGKAGPHLRPHSVLVSFLDQNIPLLFFASTEESMMPQGGEAGGLTLHSLYPWATWTQEISMERVVGQQDG